MAVTAPPLPVVPAPQAAPAAIREPDPLASVSDPDCLQDGSTSGSAVAPPLTSEPPLAATAPLTSEPPLATALPLTSEPAAAGPGAGTSLEPAEF